MNAIVTYKELSDLIEKKFKIRPRFTTLNEKCVEVSYKPGVFLPAIAVKLHIEAMRKDIVCISYECGRAASLLIAGVVAYLEEQIPNGVEIDTAEKRVNIYPERIAELEQIMKYVILSDISFEADAVRGSLSVI